MRIGYCLALEGIWPEAASTGFAQELVKMGYDYLELRGSEIVLMDSMEFAKYVMFAKRVNLPCEVFNFFLPYRLRVIGEEPELTRVEGYVNEVAERAALLGGKVVVFGSAAARRVPDGFDMGRAWEQLLGFWRMACKIFAQSGIEAVIKPLNSKECNIVNSVEEARRLMFDVAEPNARVLADYYQMATEGEGMGGIYTARGMLGHVHFSDPANHGCPTVYKEEYGAFFRALKDIGYDRQISIEAASAPSLAEAEAALHMLKGAIT